jgi:RND family efflux transporter MFP subunit
LSEAERRLQRAREDLSVGPLQDKENLAKATRDLLGARNDVEQARREVEHCQVRSPLDGFIDNKVEVVPGQVLSGSSSLARIVQLNPIHVRVDFPQDRLEEVALGQKAEIVLDSFPQETFYGTVLRIAPIVNPQLRVFPVVVQVDNPGNRIKAGISGFVRLRAKRRTTVVPSAAVVQHGSKAMVFRVAEGRAQLCEIQTKHLVELGAIEVRQGLTPGDEVVVYFSNFYRHWHELTDRGCYLQDNDTVDTDWRKWARRD